MSNWGGSALAFSDIRLIGNWREICTNMSLGNHQELIFHIAYYATKQEIWREKNMGQKLWLNKILWSKALALTEMVPWGVVSPSCDGSWEQVVPATKVIRNATGGRCIRPGRTMAIAGVTHYPGDSNGSRSNGSSAADTIATLPHTGTRIECIKGAVHIHRKRRKEAKGQEEQCIRMCSI